MKWMVVLLLSGISAQAQTLQLHYDPRKTLDPGRNTANFPSVYFEYWKGTDSGSILVKVQADLSDQRHNTGKSYLQVAKTFRLHGKLQLHASYSGGLGLTTPREYSYAITNTFQGGLSYPFTWQGAFCSAVVDLKFIPYKRPTTDPILTLYWWRGLHHYRLEFLGDFSVWTENRNRGDQLTAGEKGKRFSFFGEPQLWVKVHSSIFLGTRVNLFYHVLTPEPVFQVYPTLGIRCRL